MRGIVLSLLGALLGAVLWVGIANLPIRLFLAGLAAGVAGASTGFGMRLGAPAASTGQRLLAVLFSAGSVALGRYGTYAFSRGTLLRLDLPTLHAVAALCVSGWISWVLFAVAAWFAWSTSRR